MIDAITKYNEPTQTQLDALDRSYNATVSVIARSNEAKAWVPFFADPPQFLVKPNATVI